MAKTNLEKIEVIKTQIQQLENQKKQLLQKQKEEARKVRTKRLIERGAIAESLVPNAETLTNEQFKLIISNALKIEQS